VWRKEWFVTRTDSPAASSSPREGAHPSSGSDPGLLPELALGLGVPLFSLSYYVMFRYIIIKIPSSRQSFRVKAKSQASAVENMLVLFVLLFLGLIVYR
jgi:hypothetical protein